MVTKAMAKVNCPIRKTSQQQQPVVLSNLQLLRENSK